MRTISKGVRPTQGNIYIYVWFGCKKTSFEIMFVSRSTLVGILRRFNKFVPSLLAETLYINNKTQPTAMAAILPLHHYLIPISRPGKIHNGTYLRSWVFSKDLLNSSPVPPRGNLISKLYFLAITICAY